MRSIEGEIREITVYWAWRDHRVDIEMHLGDNLRGDLNDYLWEYIWVNLWENLWANLRDVIKEHLMEVL